MDTQYGEDLEDIHPRYVEDAKEALGLMGMTATNPEEDITDRAKRYRAQSMVEGPRQCVICGARPEKLDVMHLDGNEGNGEARNLAYGCRSCNARLSAAFKRIGAGVRTRQYSNPPKHNPSEIPTFQQYAWAVSHHSHKAHDEGGAIIHATPRSKRIEYAKRIAELKHSRGTDRREEVPF